MIVGELSRRDLPRLMAEDSLVHAACILREAGSEVAAVMVDGQLFGCLSESALVRAMCADGFDPHALTVRQVCDRQPPLCPVTAAVGHALKLMREHRQGWLVLIDDRHDPVGTVSLVELLDLIVTRLPEQYRGPEPESVHRVRGD